MNGGGSLGLLLGWDYGYGVDQSEKTDRCSDVCLTGAVHIHGKFWGIGNCASVADGNSLYLMLDWDNACDDRRLDKFGLSLGYAERSLDTQGYSEDLLIDMVENKSIAPADIDDV